MTMLLATHEMGFAREVSSKVVFLYEGRIEEEGPPEQMFNDPTERPHAQLPAQHHRSEAAVIAGDSVRDRDRDVGAAAPRQSEWNLSGLVHRLGRRRPDRRGLRRSRAGGEQLRDAGLLPDVLHTSVQLRAIRTAELALDALDRKWIPVRRSWRLNERHYGALQGKNKRETVEEFGAEQVQLWRRSYDVPPPPLAIDDPMSGIDERYADVPREELPRPNACATSSSACSPTGTTQSCPTCAPGDVVLVAAHGNTLRALRSTSTA